MHEHNEITGMLLTRLRNEDIRTMKAIIQCHEDMHYPQQNLYEMCDKYGLYLLMKQILSRMVWL